MFHNRLRFTIGCPALLLVGFLALTWSVYRATPAQATAERGRLTRTMEAFLADQQPAENRPPLAFTPCIDGFADIYPCSNVDLLSFIPLSTFSATAGNDSWGWTDPMTGREYALMGLNNGTGFVDITDPINPIYLGKLPTHTTSSSWRDIKVYADHAFVVSEASGHGLQVFDLTELRDVPAPPVTFSETAFYGGFGNAHNLAINEDTGFAYAVGTSTCSGGLHIVDIQNPTSPIFAGCFSSDGYTHDTQCVVYTGPDATRQEDEICFNSNEDTLTIVDVSNKAAPLQLSRTGYPGSGYTHQGWLTEDQRYFLLDDELDESNFGHNTYTYVWDVSNLEEPILLGHYTAPVAAIDHNQYVKGDHTYQANYRSGLRILDITGVADVNLFEAGYFDIYPTSNSASFNGAWSVYPYFESGVVIISGIEQGLFMVQPTLAAEFYFHEDDTFLEVCGDGADAALTTVLDRNGYTGQVTLSALGLPAGATPTFDPNPIDIPGDSLLTVTTTGVPAGVYDFSLLGDDGVLTDTLSMALQVADAPPAIPDLLTPADGATNQLTQPTFTWSAAEQGHSYTIDIATDPAFSNIVLSATLEATTYSATEPLEPSTTYYWRVSSSNVCGQGGTSAVFSFTVRDVPPILLVDDDDNGPDVRAFYTAGLDSLGVAYDIWDTTNSDNEPDSAQLAPYRAVIWFTGDEFGGAAGPGAAGETALSAWLDAGNCLFISSQDYHYDRGLTSFMATYLGVGSATDDISQTTVTGQGALFNGLGPYVLIYPFTNYSDRILPAVGQAETAFMGNQDSAAVLRDNTLYKTTFWGFPWEALPTTTARDETLERVVDWCGVAADTGLLAGQVVDATNGDDLAGVLITAMAGVDVFTTSTNADGEYDLALPAGSYSVTAEKEGYFPESVSDVVMVVGDTTTQDFSLTPITPAITLSKTVSLDGSCGAVSEIMVLPGTTVTYCFTVTNSGNVTFTTHDLVDDQLGVLLDDLPFVLNPGAETNLLASTMISATVVNTAVWTASDGENSAEASATATVEVVAPGAIFSPASHEVGAPGATVTHTFTLTNNGNITDSFTLTVSGNTWMTTLLEPSPVTLGPGEASQLGVIVAIPQTPAVRDVVIASDVFTLTATANLVPSVSASVNGETAAQVNVGVMLSGDSLVTGLWGDTITHTIQVTNLGSYTDTFTLTLGDHAWFTIVGPSSVMLGPGQTGQTTVAVTLETIGSDAVVLTAASALDPTTTASATLTTRTYGIFAPVVFKR